MSSKILRNKLPESNLLKFAWSENLKIAEQIASTQKED